MSDGENTAKKDILNHLSRLVPLFMILGKLTNCETNNVFLNSSSILPVALRLLHTTLLAIRLDLQKT